MTRRILVLLCAGMLAGVRPAVADSPPAPARAYALLIGGLGGQAPYTQWYQDWLSRFQKFLSGPADVPAVNITMLSGTAATAEAVTGALARLAGQIQPRDQFILFIVGHGAMNGASPTLMLPGPDLTADQLAAALAAIPSKNQVILNFSASSGDFLKHLVSPDRVNITATSPTEMNEPVFAEFFLRGLESKRAAANQAGPVNMLDAYNWATRQIALWIVRWQETGVGPKGDATQAMWKADGRETIEIFRKLYAGDPTRKLDPASNASAEDAALPLSPPNGLVTEAWASRRVIDEHATIEDCGQELAVSALGDKGFQPILGAQPGDPGYLAKQTVLGAPLAPGP
jgi:hypothetical protein